MAKPNSNRNLWILAAILGTAAVGGIPLLAANAPVVARHFSPGADLHGASLPGANLQQADLWGADLRKAYLTRANLNGARFPQALLRGADMQQADLFMANCMRADLRGVLLQGADLWGATLREADLRDAGLRGADLREADLRWARLSRAVLWQANLKDAILRNADLQSAQLQQADLRDADLSDADVRGADLRATDFEGTVLWRADLRNADFRSALHLTQAQFDAAITDQTTRLSTPLHIRRLAMRAARAARATHPPRSRTRAGPTELYVGLGHSDLLTAVGWSPDGTALATGSRDQTVILWDTVTWTPRATLAGHTGPVSTLAWSPDGKALASSDQSAAILWDATTGRRRAVLRTAERQFEALAWSPEGRTLATSDYSRSVALWNATTGKLSLTWRGPPGQNYGDYLLAWSPNGRILATGNQANGVQPLVLWDAATGRRRASLPAQGYLTALAWSPDGRTLASCGGQGLMLWDVASGNARHRGDAIYDKADRLTWSPDGRALATAAGDDKQITLWDSASGRRLRDLKSGSGAFGSPLQALAWSPDGTRIAISSDYLMILWDSRSGKRVAALRGLAGPLAWSPDGKRIAVGSYRPGETAAICEGAAGNRQAILARRLAPISLARPAWLPNGKAIVATAGEGLGSSAVRWDVGTGKLQARMSGIGEPWEPIRDLRLSPDGKYVAAATGSLGFSDAGGPTGIAAVWDATSGTFRHEFPSPIGLTAWSPDGSLLATGGHTGTLDLWKAGTWEHEGALAGPAQWLEWGANSQTLVSGQAWAGPHPLNGHWTTTLWDVSTRKSPTAFDGPNGFSFTTALSPNGKWIATAADDRTVAVWDATSGAAHWTLPLSAAPRQWYAGWPLLAWDPSSEILATGSSERGGIRLWSAATGQMIGTLSGPVSGLRALAWSPEGRTLAAGGEDGTASLWSEPFRQPRASLRGHTAAIQSLAWSRDGQTLATASADGSLRLWRSDTGRELAAFYAIDAGKEWLIMTAEGYFAASAHGADCVFVRARGRLLPLGRLRLRLERPDIVQRALAVHWPAGG